MIKFLAVFILLFSNFSYSNELLKSVACGVTDGRHHVIKDLFEEQMVSKDRSLVIQKSNKEINYLLVVHPKFDSSKSTRYLTFLIKDLVTGQVATTSFDENLSENEALSLLANKDLTLEIRNSKGGLIGQPELESIKVVCSFR